MSLRHILRAISRSARDETSAGSYTETELGQDLDSSESERVESSERATDGKLFRLLVKSYAIDKTWNFLRHVYLLYDDRIEIHAGMSEPGDPRDLMFSVRNYYGVGRTEGRLELCRRCLDDTLTMLSRRNKRFHVMFNNCDTMVPMVMQTRLLWIASVCVVAGVLSLCLAREFNVIVVAAFAPAISQAILLLWNKLDASDRSSYTVWRCEHA